MIQLKKFKKSFEFINCKDNLYISYMIFAIINSLPLCICYN